MIHRPLRALVPCMAIFVFGPGCAMTTAAEPGPQRDLLTNAGFEEFDAAAGLPTAFGKAVYGAQPIIGADATVSVEGKQSLKVSATEPSDTAFAAGFRHTCAGAVGGTERAARIAWRSAVY